MKNGITSSTVRNPHESMNIILQWQCHYRNISQAAPTPVMYGPQKQNFNFLSLSVGSRLLYSHSHCMLRKLDGAKVCLEIQLGKLDGAKSIAIELQSEQQLG
ncbi:hypothetical protein JHK82_050462 [Glycine max]|nr:hypothetical protein JHK82_050462 [Glycine max]